MSEIITISSQKGGVGKTATAVNLSSALAELGQRVLLVDLDPQANATTHLGFGKDNSQFNIFHLLNGSKTIYDIILSSRVENLSLIPSNIGLVGIEKEFYKRVGEGRELMLQEAVDGVKRFYDFIIIDSPPALGAITINALSTSDSIIIPIQCEFFALEGLAQLLNTISLLRKTINPKLKIRGFLPTMFSIQNNLSKQVLSELEHHFEDRLFKSQDSIIAIPRNVKIAEAPSFGKPVTAYSSNSSGAKAYRDLAKALLQSSS
jgi:chromosome partitioning protein